MLMRLCDFQLLHFVSTRNPLVSSEQSTDEILEGEEPLVSPSLFAVSCGNSS